MSSILTNTSAMVALQTLKSVNRSLMDTQSQISTGKQVASARDNSAVWAISKSMDSDVKGFQAISESLALGESTVAVARNAAETTTDLLTEIKGRVVAAQEENVDRTKIQTDIDELAEQINTVVNAAQFNGLNLVKGTETVNILSSLDRNSAGVVNASNIDIERQDLTASAGTYGGGGSSLAANGTVSSATVSDDANTAEIAVTYENGSNYTVNIGSNSVVVAADTDANTTEDAIAAAVNALGLDGITATSAAGTLTINSTRAFEGVDISVSEAGGTGTGAVTVDDGGGAGASGTITQRAETVTFNSAAAVAEGDSYRVTYNGNNYDYIAGRGETMEDVAKGLKTALDGADISTLSTRVTQDTNGDWVLNVDNSDTTDVTDFAVTGENGGTASGGLFGLDNIDVTTNTGASNALDNIETLIQNSIDAAANFGSAEGRIEIQSEFVGKLMDSLRSGIGALVDADMEEASARLQALQVQQQLATQSLSIANQAPQNILALFR